MGDIQWLRRGPFLTTTYLPVDISNPERGHKCYFWISYCPRSHWTSPKAHGMGDIQWLRRGQNFALFWPPPTSTWIFLILNADKNWQFLDHLPGTPPTTSSCPPTDGARSKFLVKCLSKKGFNTVWTSFAGNTHVHNPLNQTHRLPLTLIWRRFFSHLLQIQH